MKKFIKIFVAVGVLIVLTVGGFFAWKYWWSPNVIDETADWQIYRNEEYGFEMKYPNEGNWKAEEGRFINYDLSCDSSYNSGKGCEVDFVVEQNEGFSLDEWIEQKLYYLYFPRNETQFTVAGIEGKKTDITILHSLEGVMVVFMKDGLVYQFTTDAEGESILTQMLSTFSFIESQATSETADWQIYRNEEAGFEMKYPKDFGGQVWNPHFWPPQITVVVEEDPIEKGCPGFSVEGQSEIRMNDIDYTLYEGRDGALGSSYFHYCYVTEKDLKYYVINFLIRVTNGCGKSCGPYCGTQYETECRNFDFSRDVERPINKMLSTFKFIE